MTFTDDDVTEETPVEGEKNRWGRVESRLESLERICMRIDDRSLSTHSDLERRVGLLESKAMVLPAFVAIIAMGLSLYSVSQAHAAVIEARKALRIHALAHPEEATVERAGD